MLELTWVRGHSLALSKVGCCPKPFHTAGSKLLCWFRGPSSMQLRAARWRLQASRLESRTQYGQSQKLRLSCSSSWGTAIWAWHSKHSFRAHLHSCHTIPWDHECRECMSCSQSRSQAASLSPLSRILESVESLHSAWKLKISLASTSDRSSKSHRFSAVNPSL